MAFKLKFILFLAVVFVFLGVADVSFADSNCYWGCGGSESLRCRSEDKNGEGSDCDWVCDTSSTLICVDPEHGSAICNLDWGCPDPIYECRGRDSNGEGSDCDWRCQGSGPACDNGGGGGGGGGGCIPNGGSCVGQPGSACCSGICDVRDREGEERADVCIGNAPPPPPPPSPLPAPTIDIQCNSSNGPCNISWNSSSNLSWSSSNANSCSASGDWSGSKGTSGSEGTGNLTTPKTYNYTLTCSGAGGSGSDSVNVAVVAPSPNNPSNVTVTQPNYCTSGPAATTNWDYSDPSGSPQSAYQVQIDDQGSFSSPEYDSGKFSCSGCRSNTTPQGLLQFNTTYRSRVRVWNQSDIASGWTESSTWKTPIHAYPQAEFTFASTIPGQQKLTVDIPVQFTDQSTCYDNSQNQVVCSSWSWDFADGGTSTQRNPRHKYSQIGTYNINLKATDQSGNNCSITKPVNIQELKPIWKEVNPGG